MKAVFAQNPSNTDAIPGTQLASGSVPDTRAARKNFRCKR